MAGVAEHPGLNQRRSDIQRRRTLLDRPSAAESDAEGPSRAESEGTVGCAAEASSSSSSDMGIFPRRRLAFSARLQLASPPRDASDIVRLRQLAALPRRVSWRSRPFAPTWFCLSQGSSDRQVNKIRKKRLAKLET